MLPLEFARLRSPSEILRQMTAVDAQLAASFLSRRIDLPNAITGIVLDLASDDLKTTARLLNRLITIDDTDAVMLIVSMALIAEDPQIIGLSASLLATAIRHEPAHISLQIARLAFVNGNPRSVTDEDRSLWFIMTDAGKYENFVRLLDRLMEGTPEEGRRVVGAMLSMDITYFKCQLSSMIHQEHLALAGELLLQLKSQDPDGPWAAVARALAGRDFKNSVRDRREGSSVGQLTRYLVLTHVADGVQPPGDSAGEVATAVRGRCLPGGTPYCPTAARPGIRNDHVRGG